jgi:hypothetical protein
VYIDADPAGEGEAEVRVRIRGVATDVVVRTDASGTYTFATIDAAHWFRICSGWVTAWVNSNPRWGTATPRAIPLASCVGGRTLGDVRIGWRKAAYGQVTVNGSDAGLGVATVELLHPVTSLVLGEAVPTRDDGSYDVWFPFELKDPGCNWLLRATVGTVSETRPLTGPPSAPSPCLIDGIANYFNFTS